MLVKQQLGAVIGGVDIRDGAYEDGVLVVGRGFFPDWPSMADYREVLEDRAKRRELGVRIVEVVPEPMSWPVYMDGWKTTVLG